MSDNKRFIHCYFSVGDPASRSEAAAGRDGGEPLELEVDAGRRQRPRLTGAPKLGSFNGLSVGQLITVVIFDAA